MNIMMQIITEPGGWVGIGVLLFLALAVWKVFPLLGKNLDQYGAGIAHDIEEAAELKREAEKLLAEAKKNVAAAQANASEIIERARFEAKLIADEAEKEIEREIERKMVMLDEKIAREQAAAVEHVRVHAVENAIAAATKALQEEFKTAKSSEKLIEKSLRLISSDIS